jgi:hypothetical protein
MSASQEETFWSDVQKLVVQCAIQPVSTDGEGKKVYGVLESTCQELKEQGSKVNFVLNGSAFEANLVESELSDDGDLYDVYVTDAQNKLVASRKNVPSFGDALLGLAGGKAPVREVSR